MRGMPRRCTGTLHHICQVLKSLLKCSHNDSVPATKVVMYTSQDPTDVTNSIFLLGAFLCLHLGATPQEAWQPFQSCSDVCLPYRDATWVKSTYELSVRDCWAGLVRASYTGLYSPSTFDKHEVQSFVCFALPPYGCVPCLS